MGALTSRQNAGVEEVDSNLSRAYRYPPKSGNYFGSHFIMGGERFDTVQPEAYLFGENTDLNFLGNKPAPFPYQAPQPNEPTKTLKSVVNIRKESLKFVRVNEEPVVLGTDDESANRNASSAYNIEFTFDSDVRCSITIYYFCTEEITSTSVAYTSKCQSLCSETFCYKRGAGQIFSESTHSFDPSNFKDENLSFNVESDIIPVVIQCVADEGDEPYQSHMLLATVEKSNADGGYVLKPLKQKQFVDGLCYLLQEIYGIENKNAESTKTTSDDDIEENGAECVICMCDLRDTLILPCRHLCLCYSCADSLRYQANNCPICRAPFRALLQIKALRKSTNSGGSNLIANHLVPQPQSINPLHPAPPEHQEHVPPGYEAVSLIEALNGPTLTLYQQVHAGVIPPNSLTLTPNLQDSQRKDRSCSLPTAQDVGTSPSIPSPIAVIKSRRVGSATLSASTRRHRDGDGVVVPLGPGGDTLAEAGVKRKEDGRRVCPLASGEANSDIESSNEQKNELRVQSQAEKPISKLRKSASTRESGDKRRGSHPNETTRLLNISGENREGYCNRSESFKVVTTSPGGVTQAHSLVEVNSAGTSPVKLLIQAEAVSSSTPDSLHLCERHRISDLSPGAEDSDYFTPEDPNTTILCLSDEPTDSASSAADILGTNIAQSVAGKHVFGDYCEICDAAPMAYHTRQPGSGRIKGCMPPYLESSVSLPNSPRNQALTVYSGGTGKSGASSADSSFSSTSSTRLLLAAASNGGGSTAANHHHHGDHQQFREHVA